MTKKDLFRIIIKLFGLLILVNSVVLFLGQFSLFISADDWTSVLVLTLGAALTCGLISLLVFFPDTVIKVFKLDKGFDDQEVDINDINAQSLIQLGVLIIGGFFILNSFAPLLLTIAYKVYETVDRLQLFKTPEYLDNTKLYINAIELCTGLLLVSNYRTIARFILSNNKTNESS